MEKVGQATLESIRDTDIGCRYGGDEFCIILPRTSAGEAETIANRLIDNFKRHAGRSKISFSIGISDTGPEEFLDIDTLVSEADKLMYQAKAKSKKKAGFYISTITDG